LFAARLVEHLRGAYDIQRLFGICAGIVAVLIGALNFIIGVAYFNWAFSVAITNLSVWSAIVFGILFALSSLRRSKSAGWIQVAVFLSAAILSALTSTIGELTSSLYLIFGILLMFELGLPRVPSIVVTVVVLACYPVALSIGYSKYPGGTAIRTIESVLMVALFVVLFGAILLRHWFKHREEAELLESRVAERTQELKSALDERQAALEERQVMLQEIHHRVKNNLQIVASLLRMEAAKVTDEGVRRATENSIRRIHAMALVHETLYQHEPLHAVDLEKYMHNLIGSLRGTLTPENEIEVDAGGSLFVDPDFAIPFGLVLSELVTNSVRHAFPDNRRGTVRVVLRIADRVDLTVSDDGVGFAKDFSLSRSASLGLQIVNSLVNQLSGRIELVPATPGASWLLSFPRAEIPSNLPAR